MPGAEPPVVVARFAVSVFGRDRPGIVAAVILVFFTFGPAWLGGWHGRPDPLGGSPA